MPQAATINPTRAFMLKIALPAVLAFLGIGWASMSMIPTRTLPAAKRTSTPLPLRAVLLEAGISADSLSAAGVQSGQVAQVVADAGDYMGSNPTVLSDAQDALRSARQAQDQMEKKIRSGQASQEQVASLAGLRSATSTAQTGVDNAISALFNAATASLSQGQKTLLGHIRANTHYGLPVQYTVIDREPADWTSLGRAVRARAIYTRRSETLRSEFQTLLTEADADQNVSTAASNITQNGAAVRTAWNSALAE